MNKSGFELVSLFSLGFILIFIIERCTTERGSEDRFKLVWSSFVSTHYVNETVRTMTQAENVAEVMIVTILSLLLFMIAANHPFSNTTSSVM